MFSVISRTLIFNKYVLIYSIYLFKQVIIVNVTTVAVYKKIQKSLPTKFRFWEDIPFCKDKMKCGIKFLALKFLYVSMLPFSVIKLEEFCETGEVIYRERPFRLLYTGENLRSGQARKINFQPMFLEG